MKACCDWASPCALRGRGWTCVPNVHCRPDHPHTAHSNCTEPLPEGGAVNGTSLPSHRALPYVLLPRFRFKFKYTWAPLLHMPKSNSDMQKEAGSNKLGHKHSSTSPPLRISACLTHLTHPHSTHTCSSQRSERTWPVPEAPHATIHQGFYDVWTRRYANFGGHAWGGQRV